jgi:hypothetical protein
MIPIPVMIASMMIHRPEDSKKTKLDPKRADFPGDGAR